MKKTDYVYFFYSDEQIKEKNDVLKNSGHRFEAGIVVVNGKKQKFSQVTTNKNIMKRYIDSYVVCEGILGDMTYTLPSES
jgi:hypothetical protein